jgi:uncharacterized protein YciI
MFIITLTYVRPLEEIDALMPKHVAWLRRQYKEGLFIASGRQKPRAGGVILATSDSRENLETTMKSDPFVEQGLATFSMCEFMPSMTAPGAEILKRL